jgi:hypothetical protein
MIVTPDNNIRDSKKIAPPKRGKLEIYDDGFVPQTRARAQ